MNSLIRATFLMIVIMTAFSANAQSLDRFGGLKANPCSATGWFHPEKIGDQWWLCTPEGHVWWMVAAYNVSTDPHKTDMGLTYDSIVTSKYGNSSTIWGPATVRRLKSWGFNSVAEFSVKWVLPTTTCGWPPSCLGGWEKTGGKQPNPVPMIAMVQPSMYSLRNAKGYAPDAVKDIQSGINTSYYGNGWNSTFPDIWDANFSAWLDGELKSNESTRAAENSPWVVGWVSDECDALLGLCGAGPDMPTSPAGYNQRHQALMTLVTSPVQNANPGRAMISMPQVYASQEVFSKSALKKYLQSRYTTIADLNAAWGSAYSQWDSTGVQVQAEVIGTTDGSSVSYSKALANKNISPLSIAVRIAGVKVAGDCPQWLCSKAPRNGGTFTGSSTAKDVTVAEGDVSYERGSVVVKFKQPPPKGQTVTVDYIYGGWGSGNGLMDEDGRHSLIPRDKVRLGSNTVFNGDMDAFLTALAAQYFSVTHERIKHYSPHTLYFGPGVMGTWGGVANRNVLSAAAKYVDVLTWRPDYTRLQTELNYVATHFGDKPIILWHGAKATSDSAMWRYANATDSQCQPCNTQEQRGQYYADTMRAFVNTRNTVFNSRTIVGIRWWEFHDNWKEGNWGLVSLHDNAYDGVEACEGVRNTSQGTVAFTEESIPEWEANHPYVVPESSPKAGARIQVVIDGARYLFEVARPGISGNSPPPWPPKQDAFAGDGTVVWKNLGVKTSQRCYGDFLAPVKQANTLWMKQP